jgi:hypothetical protein
MFGNVLTLENTISHLHELIIGIVEVINGEADIIPYLFKITPLSKYSPNNLS